MHLVGFAIEIYYDARPYGRQSGIVVVVSWPLYKKGGQKCSKFAVSLAYGKRYISKSPDCRSDAKQTPCIIFYYNQQNAQLISLKYTSQQCFLV
jgi:hypothetical protein